MNPRHRRSHRLASGTLAWTFVVALVGAACTSGPPRPEKVVHERPLPACATFTEALVRLGMPDPQPQPPGGPSRGPIGLECVFAAAADLTKAGVSSASVMVIRPDTDPYAGAPLQEWGASYAASNQCEGDQRPAAEVPNGRYCYTVASAHSGSATLLGFARDSGVRVRVQWFDPVATQVAIRATAEQKAAELTQDLIGKL